MKASHPEKPNILYVEDEIILALDVADSLQTDAGWTIHVAHNLVSARQILNRQKIDFALLDVNLGQGETCLELAHDLTADGVGVLLVTGYNRKALPLTNGFEIVEKPFDLQDLCATMSRLMGLI